MQQFSLETVMTTAVITFVFSGILGALFRDWLDRPKPRIVVTSFGFCGGKEPIEITRDIQALSQECGWSPRLHRYEKYEKLVKLVRKLRRAKERLKLGQAAADRWLADTKTWEHDKSTSATIDELDQCPFFADEIIGNTLFGCAIRGEIADLPVSADQLEASTVVTEFSESKNGWHLYMRRMNVLFPTATTKGETEKKALLSIGISMSRGCKANIYHYIREFRRNAVEDINQVAELCAHLERLLLPASRIAVNAVIANDGAKPFTIRPFGKMVFHNQEISQYSPLLQLEVEDRSGTPAQPPEVIAMLSGLPQKDEGSDGDDVLVEDIFPTAGQTRHVFFAPRTSQELRYASVDVLGATAERVLSMYKASVLQCSIVLLDSNGAQLGAPAVLFGKSASNDDIKSLSINM